MSPAPSRIHQYVLFDLSGQIRAFLQDKPCQAYAAPFDVRIPDDKGVCNNVVQPDLSIICDRKKLDDQGCAGAPDLIIEILSPATASRDLKEKFSNYSAISMENSDKFEQRIRQHNGITPDADQCFKN